MDWYDFKLKRRAVAAWVGTITKIRIPVGFWFFVLEIAGCFSVIYGIWLYSHPISFIFAGIAAVYSIERQTRKDPSMSPEKVAYIQNQLKTALASGEDPFAPPYNVPLSTEWIAYAAALRRKQ